MPAVSSMMKADSLETSSSHFRDLGCIVDDRSRFVGQPSEPLVSQGLNHDEIDIVPEQISQRLLQILHAPQPWPEIVILGVLDQKIDVAARRVELRRADRA